MKNLRKTYKIDLEPILPLDYLCIIINQIKYISWLQKKNPYWNLFTNP